jgi:tetratricopeptide (TPR) repeat protein
VSRDRQQTPQSDKPFTATLKLTLQQGSVWPLFADANKAFPKPDDAQALYDRGSELRRQRRFAEALAAFDGAIALKPDYAEAHNSRGIVLAGLTRLDDALASFDKAIALKPDYAEAYNNRGIVLQDTNRLDDAISSFDKAIALLPDHAGAYNNRAVALHDLKRFADALEGFDKAIALQPDFAAAHYNRAVALHALKRYDEALAGFEEAIARKPDYAEAYHNLGVLLQDLKRVDDAIAAYDRAIALQPDRAETYFNKGFCLLQLGRYQPGWDFHEWRNKCEERSGDASFPQPLWLGDEDIAGKTLFVHCEQGLGDTLQFCRYGKLAKAQGINVVMSVQQPLRRLLRQMSRAVEIIDQGALPAAFDYHCPIMSLPHALRTAPDAVPSQQRYIVAEEPLRKKWDARLPLAQGRAKPRIGVAWAGNPKQRNDHNRSMTLRTLAPLFAADAHWISLQKDLRPGDATLLAELPIVSFGDDLEDFADTAGLLDVLDLVITVDTSVAHLAGAMGKPVWIMLTYYPDWRWLLERDDSPWYPTARLFRQDETRAWDSVVARVHAAAQDFVRSHDFVRSRP